MARKDWFDSGLCFDCTQCGSCCTGPSGWVWISEAECQGIARLLGLSVASFRAAYTHLVRGRPSLQERETEHGFDCIFLDRSTTPGRAGCTIYAERPAQCRTWPFWPRNLKGKRDWKRAARSCPGIGKGERLEAEEIRRRRDATPTPV